MDSSRTSLDGDYDAYPAHTRLPNEQVLELYAELTLQGAYHLLPYEEDWKARRPFLESRGYELRPRYSQDWWPSWIGTNINPFFCEDSIDSCVRYVSIFYFILLFFYIIIILFRRISPARPSSQVATGTLSPDRRRGSSSQQASRSAVHTHAHDVPRCLTF